MTTTEIERATGSSQDVVTAVQAAQELASLPAAAAMIRGWAMSLQYASQIAQALVNTPFVPDSYRPRIPERADAAQRQQAIETAVATGAAAIMHGASIGFDPLAAMQNIYVVSGRPGLYAEAMVALLKANGHQIWVEDLTDTRAVVCGRRFGDEHVERVTVTMDQAKRAGWTRNPKYGAEPQSMLYARAASRACRLVAPDVLKGIGASVEEMQDGEDHGDAAASVAGTRTVRRAALTPSTAPAADDDRPPLPGEQASAAAEEKPAAKPAAARVNKRGTTKAEPERAPEPAPATSSPAADDDRPPLPGEDQAEAPAPEPAPERPPGGITDAQSRKMHAAFRDCQISSRDDRLAYVYDVIQREIASAGDLTKDEASRVIDSLQTLAEARDETAEFVEAEVVDDKPGY